MWSPNSLLPADLPHLHFFVGELSHASHFTNITLSLTSKWEPSPQLCCVHSLRLQGLFLQGALSFFHSGWISFPSCPYSLTLPPVFFSYFLFHHIVLPLRSKFSVPFTESLFQNHRSLPSYTQPTHQPLLTPTKLLQLFWSYQLFEEDRCSTWVFDLEGASLRTPCCWENMQLSASSHDDLQEALTPQNCQSSKCMGIGVHHSLFKTCSAFPWLCKWNLNLLAWPLGLSSFQPLSWGHILVFLSSPTWTCHHRQNGLCTEITFLSVMQGPFGPLSLENLHAPHFSSHLLPIEIPPKPIKHCISVFFPTHVVQCTLFPLST